MQPTKKTIADLFEDRSQYLIPLFQRGYVWTLEKQIARLWDDVVDRVDAMREHAADAKAVGSGTKLKKLRKHFLGAIIVGSETEDGDAVPKREVIDGQQRLTTLQILLLAFRDTVKGIDASTDDDLNGLTSNRGSYSSKSDKLKVWPTNVGRDVMQSLYEAGGMKSVAAMYPVKARDGSKFERPPMAQAYLYFSAIIGAYIRGKRHDDPMRETDPVDTFQTIGHAVVRSISKDNDVIAPYHDREIDLSRVKDLKRALEKQFQIMRLQLDDEDDPQIIFETLNALGEPLTPSDLIRNYLFLRASRATLDVDDLYHRYWRDFDEKPDETTAKKGAKFWKEPERQGRLISPRLDLFFFHYIGLRQKESSKVSHVFQDFKEWWEAGESRHIQNELERVQSLSNWFETVIAPGQTTHFDRSADV